MLEYICHESNFSPLTTHPRIPVSTRCADPSTISVFRCRMASVQTLPPEILSAVFRLTLDQPLPRLNPTMLLTKYRARMRNLLRLSLVCKEWRSVVLGDGTLWTTVPVCTSRADCQEFTTTVLRRSKHAMLDVSMVCGDDIGSPHEAIFSEVSQNFGRIKSLHFATTSPRTLHNLSVPAQKLETLSIFTAEEPAELGLLFGGNLPALRSLALVGLPSWPLGLFSNLKELYLALPSSYPAVRVSSLIDVMSRSPGLEQIEMSSFLSMVNDSPPSSHVRLPNLQRFTMRDCDSATLLSHTIAPATADIKVVMDHCKMRAIMRIPPRDCNILCSVPTDTSTLGFLTESAVFVLQQDQKVGFGMGFYRSRSSRPSLRVFDHPAPVGSFARQSIDALANRPNYFQHISDLSVVLPADTVVPWSKLLRSFGRLGRLSTIALHAPSLLSALMVTGEDDHPICPALKRLGIHERDDGHVFVLDPDGWGRFSAVRRALDCAVMEVTIHESRGREWKYEM